MKKILVVVDMQKDFINGSLGSKEAEAIVPAVLRKIEVYKQNGDGIYFTKDTHLPEYLQTQEGRNLPVEHCIKGTEGWELEKDIQLLQQQIESTQDGEVVFEKGVFGSERLAGCIRESIGDQKEVSIEVVGLCTDICVLSNAILFKAYMPEVAIQVDASCCAGVTPESHQNALNAMKMCQIQIINE